jgi:lipoprotein signal peptidase
MQAARGASLTGPVASDEQPKQDTTDVPAGLPVGMPRHRMGLVVAVAVAVLALDIATKCIIVATLSPTQPIRLLGGFLHLRQDRNPGAAFSFAPGLTILFSLIAITVIVVILRSSRRIRSAPWAITLGLLLGGATGNLVDRIFRSPGIFRGWVVDWIQIPHWPVFNLADSAIVCGGILAVLLSARGIRLDGQRETR